MIRIILIASLLALTGCLTTRTDDALNCEALRPDLPVKYHAKTTDAETTANIRRANARFTAACG
jgi:hypothetical protein